MTKLFRITTVPLSLEKLLEGQLAFMKQYFDVTAISAERDRLEEYGRQNGIQTFHVDMTREITPLKDLQALIKMYRFFKLEKPEIVHTHTPKAGLLGMLAAKMARVPYRLHTVAGLPLMETSGVKRKILEQVERLTYNAATRIYPNSKGLYSYILQHNFAPLEKLKILGKGSSNGIDIHYFDPSEFSIEQKSEIKKKLNISEQDLVFIFVGRIVKDKGINELVKTFVHLQKEFKEISLILVGPFEPHLDPVFDFTYEQIKQHPKILSLGYQNDVRPFFAVSDVLVFPSYREGFPNVVLQAGAMGLPSIVSNINGCNEIIEQGKNGLIIPPKEEKPLEEAMKEMILSPCLRERMKKQARRKITKNYKRDEFWNLLLYEYEQLGRKASVEAIGNDFVNP